MDYLIPYLLLGAFTGTIAGLLGVGGGLIIVPILAFIFAQQHMPNAIIMHMAIGTSLASIVFTSLSSIWSHNHHNAVLWPVVTQLAPGIVIGALAGAVIADHIAGDALKIGIGIFMLLAALQMMLNIKPKPQRDLPTRLGMTLTGTIIGSVSALIGIGGGTLTTPFLLWCNKAMRNAIATSAACGLPIAIAGTIAYMNTGLGSIDLPARSIGFVYGPALLGITLASVLFAPLGAKLAHTLPVKVLKKFFAILLVLLSMRLLVM